MTKFLAPLALPLAAALSVGCAAKDTSSNPPAAEPAPADASTAEAPADAAPADAQDIIDTAVAAGNFTTLATALEKTGLIETLKGEGPFTVFAPTDEAFAALPEGTLDELLANPEELKKILLFHVVEGKVMSTDVVNLSEAKAVSGATIAIDASDGVKVAGATVTTPDIEASNGVIHVVNAVMLPPK